MHVPSIPQRPTRRALNGRELRRTGIAYGVILLFIGLLSVTGALFVLEQRWYDLYLGILPPTELDERVRVIGIDDRAIDLVGQWPWGRDLIADGVLVLSEFGAERVLLDILFLDDSSPDLADNALEALQQSYPDGGIPLAAVEQLVIDRDARLASAIAASGNVFVLMVVDERGEELVVRLPLPEFADAAAGIGFPDLPIDPDGVSRRVPPLRLAGGRVWSHYAISALGARVVAGPDDFNESGEYTRRSVDLRLAGETVTVPLDPQGNIVVRWPRGTFAEAYPQVGFAALLEYQSAMDDLAFNIELMEGAGYIPGRFTSPLGTWRSAQSARRDLLAEADSGRIEEYRQLRRAFVALAGTLLQGGAERELLAAVDSAIDQRPDAATRRELLAIRGDISLIFRETRGIYEEVLRLQDYLEEQIPGSISLIGLTGTGTTDLGVTPFDEQAPNVGVHASLVSMLLTGDFLDQAHWVIGLLSGGFWAGLIAVLMLRFSGSPAPFIALFGTLLPLVANAAVFFTTRVYVPAASSVLPVLLLSATMLITRYRSALLDRRQIQQVFESYVSPRVIRDVLALQDSSDLQSYVDERELTAMFTDIQGFSRISELMPARDLIALLKEYFTEMTDVVLAEDGTIDKYEGDAIVAFFGAPARLESAPDHACRASIRMKKLEGVLNDRLVKDNRTPLPLLTRIGINTGEMIVGNLGTTKRINYTAMGQPMNLAARLEGVNKVYGTWICLSEYTAAKLGTDFELRRMDRVRVRGTEQPVRLFELVGYRAETSAPVREALDLFNQGLEAFEQRSWESSRNLFQTVLRIYPNDGPANTFIRRCEKFLSEPPRSSWDGIINLG